MLSAPLDFDRLLKLRLVVARFGEMDLAKWWNTRGQLGRVGGLALRRGFPRTHRFAQAQSVFAAAAHRCREVFDPPGCVTLWGLPEAIELEIVVKVLRARYEPDGADRPLVRLAKGGCRIEEWRPLLLWHLARQEFLVRDFFQGWLYEQFVAGTYQLRQDDVRSYLASATAARAWKESTVKRAASGLLQTASDVGLLAGRSTREFGPFHLPENSFLYLLHALWALEGTALRVIAARDWRMFRLDPQAVEQEILRLHQFRRLDYQVAGSLAQLALPSSTPLGFAERMVA